MDIKEKVASIEKKTTKNISELDKVSVSLKVEERTFKKDTPDEFTIDVAVVNGEDYYIPFTVQISLKELLQRFPDLKDFSVMKTGEGISTRYQVIPLGV